MPTWQEFKRHGMITLTLIIWRHALASEGFQQLRPWKVHEASRVTTVQRATKVNELQNKRQSFKTFRRGIGSLLNPDRDFKPNSRSRNNEITFTAGVKWIQLYKAFKFLASLAFLSTLVLPIDKRGLALAIETHTDAAPVISPKGLIVSSSMVLVVSASMRLLGLNSLSSQILSAATRMSIQLFVVGAIFLDHVFGAKNPWIVFAWLLTVGIMASREAASRVKYRYNGMDRDCAIATLTGVGSTFLASVLWVFYTERPWWNPRSTIPIAGMLFGNSLSALSLGLNSLVSEIAEGRDRLERRLAHGATYWEASIAMVRTALSAAFMPMINNMACTVSHL